MARALRIVLFFLCLLCITGGAYGGFVIQLHSGAEIIVNDYWETDGEIRYSRYGGVIGLPKREVRVIRPVERPVEHQEPSSRTTGLSPAAPRQQAAVEAPADLETPPGTETPAPATPEQLRYMGEFEALSGRIEDLSSMNGEDMLAFFTDLTGFRDKILSSRLGHVYSRELLEIYDMMDRTKEVYRERYQ